MKINQKQSSPRSLVTSLLRRPKDTFGFVSLLDWTGWFTVSSNVPPWSFQELSSPDVLYKPFPFMVTCYGHTPQGNIFPALLPTPPHLSTNLNLSLEFVSEASHQRLICQWLGSIVERPWDEGGDLSNGL